MDSHSLITTITAVPNLPTHRSEVRWESTLSENSPAESTECLVGTIGEGNGYELRCEGYQLLRGMCFQERPYLILPKLKTQCFVLQLWKDPTGVLRGSDCSGLCVFRMASLLDWVALESRNRSK